MISGRLKRGMRLVPSATGAANVKRSPPVVFRGFGATRGLDEHGRPEWQETVFLENEDTGHVVSLSVGYLEGFEVAP